MSKSQRASIISRPLLKSVAESMVILAAHDPGRMFQGPFDGDARNSAFGVVRKGPPEAVSQSRRTELEGLPSRH